MKHTVFQNGMYTVSFACRNCPFSWLFCTGVMTLGHIMDKSLNSMLQFPEIEKLILLCTATFNHGIRQDNIHTLKMGDCSLLMIGQIFIMRYTCSHKDLDSDMEFLVTSLKQLKHRAPHVLV